MKFLDSHFVREFLRTWKDCVETENLDKIASNSTTLTEDGKKVELKWQVNTRYAKFLYVLVRMFEPEKILEIGMANGISSAYIAKAQNLYARKKDTHVIVDPYQFSQWHNAGKALLKRLDLYHNVKVIEDYSLSAIPNLEKDGWKFDFAFLDGNHCLDYTLSDLVTTDRVLNIGGLIALDDSSDFGVKFAVKYIDKYRINLKRIRLDNKLVHFFREITSKRRRITIYQKIAEDDRGAEGT
ncbi:MAG: class I SAM-dependent methyltransferase [Desulfobacteraceae bacterium]|jgi:predicted O-methyltransferase YrrM